MHRSKYSICLIVLFYLSIFYFVPVILAEVPFDYFTNSWNVIGLKDYARGTRITPDNKLVLDNGQVVQIRLGQKLMPLNSKQTKTLLEGWLPVVLLHKTDGPVRYDIKLWATPLPNVKDWKKAFDWPTEGENYLNWIQIRATNISDKPTQARVAIINTNAAKVKDKKLTWSLPPGVSETATVRIPFSTVDDPAAFADADPVVWLQRTIDYWQGVLANTTHIETPCRKTNEGPAGRACLPTHR